LACARIDGSADRCPVRHVDTLEDRPTLVCSANFLGGHAAICLVEIGDHDRKSVCSQARGDCPSDAAGGAGNDRSIALI